MNDKKELEITNEDIELLIEMKKNCLKADVYEDDKRLLKSNAITKFLILYEENEELKKQLKDKTLLEMKLENELFNKRKEYQETYKDVRMEIKEYKKQLEEMDRKLFFTKNELDMRQKSIDNKLNQQQEFIKYLEDKIKYAVKVQTKVLLIIILTNYKSIIGVDKDENK